MSEKLFDFGYIKNKIVDDIKKEIDEYLLNIINRGNITMKPLIYFDEFEARGDNVEIKKEALSKIFNEVYQAGYEDGKRDNNLIYPYVHRDKIDHMPTVTTANLNMNK